MATINDKAIDNLWIAKSDYQGGSLATTPYSVVRKDPNNVWNTKDSKIEGTITYVKLWTVDSKGNKVPAGFKRYLKGTDGRYNYYDPNLFEPFYVYVRNNKGNFSPDLVVLADKKLHDSASSFTGQSELDLSYDGQPNFDADQSQVDLGFTGTDFIYGDDEWKWISKPVDLITGQNSIYTGGQIQMGNPNTCQVDVMNVEGMDEDVIGGTCGVSKTDKVIKNVPAKISNFYGVDGTTDIADPNKVEYTAAEMAAIHKKSGSKKSFADWYSTKGSGTIDSLSGLLNNAATLKGKQDSNKKLEKSLSNPPSADNGTTIAGLHPITFGIVALLSIAAIGFLGYKRINKK